MAGLEHCADAGAKATALERFSLTCSRRFEIYVSRLQRS